MSMFCSLGEVIQLPPQMDTKHTHFLKFLRNKIASVPAYCDSVLSALLCFPISVSPAIKKYLLLKHDACVNEPDDGFLCIFHAHNS
jgi:hypothetical protein